MLDNHGTLSIIEGSWIIVDEILKKRCPILRCGRLSTSPAIRLSDANLV